MKPELTVKRTCTAEPKGAQQQFNRTDTISINKPEYFVVTNPAMLHIDKCI